MFLDIWYRMTRADTISQGQVPKKIHNVMTMTNDSAVIKRLIQERKVITGKHSRRAPKGQMIRRTGEPVIAVQTHGVHRYKNHINCKESEDAQNKQPYTMNVKA